MLKVRIDSSSIESQIDYMMVGVILEAGVAAPVPHRVGLFAS